MMVETDIASPGVSPRPQLLPAAVVHRMERYLCRHFSPPVAAALCERLQHGHVVHLPDAASGVIAYRQGILFVAGVEYVVCDD